MVLLQWLNKNDHILMHTLAAWHGAPKPVDKTSSDNASPMKDRWFHTHFIGLSETDIDSHGPYDRYLISTPLRCLLTNAISKLLCRSSAQQDAMSG
jgi:hypothetical protein